MGAPRRDDRIGRRYRRPPERDAVFCKECGSLLDVRDRFCPACGTPNAMARLHPAFDRGHDEQPVFEIVEVPPGTPACPRCGRPVGERDPLCNACGMDLSDARVRHRAEAVGLWNRAGPPLAYPYRSVHLLAAMLRPLLVVGLGVAVVTAAVDLWVHERLDVGRFEAGPSTSTLSTVAQITTTLLLGLLVAGTVLFGVWLARAYRNLPAVGVSSLRFGLGWAVACWFVPVVDLWRPKQLADDVHRGSDPELAPGTPQWRLASPPSWTLVWWTTGLLGAGLSVAGAVVVLPGLVSAPTADATLGAFLGTLGAVLLAVSAPTLAAGVAKATERQEARAARFGAHRDRRSHLAVAAGSGDDGDGSTGPVEVPVFAAPRSREDVAGRY